jgi:hypothetical protein
LDARQNAQETEDKHVDAIGKFGTPEAFSSKNLAQLCVAKLNQLEGIVQQQRPARECGNFRLMV